MTTEHQPEPDSLLLGKDVPLSDLYDKFCLLTAFTPFPLKGLSLPRASVTARVQGLSKPVCFPILHKSDRERLQEAFDLHSAVADSEIVFVMPKKRRTLTGKLFRNLLPTLHVFAFPSGTFDKLTSSGWWDQAKGEASFLEVKPIHDWPLEF